MKYSVVALLAAASSVVAQTPGFDAITSPTAGQVLTPGSAFTIVWQPEDVDGTVTITLIEGPDSSHLVKGGVLGAGITNQDGSFVWDPVPTSQFAAYGFNITLDGSDEYQLSNGFSIGAGEGGSSSSAVYSTTTPAGYPTTTSVAVYPTTTVVSYPTSTPAAPVSYTTVSLVTNPSYPTTTTSCTTTLSTYVPSYTVSSNATFTTTTVGTGYPTTSSAATSTPSAPVSGAVPRYAASGLAAIGGLFLAFVL